MADQGDEKRLMVTCDECGDPFAAVETDDGRAVPIGSKGSCPCGGTSFSRLSEPELLADDDPDEVAGSN